MQQAFIDIYFAKQRVPSTGRGLGDEAVNKMGEAPYLVEGLKAVMIFAM